jgi:hypothetical protein
VDNADGNGSLVTQIASQAKYTYGFDNGELRWEISFLALLN